MSSSQDIYCNRNGGVVIMLLVIVTFKTNEEQTICGPITTRVYYGRTKISPQILNNFVMPNMQSVDPKN